MPDLFAALENALLEDDPSLKCAAAARIRGEWLNGDFNLNADAPILPIDDPGRPQSPQLLDPRELHRRSFASEQGRLRMLHAIAHIEFNAINIALDAVYRFRAMPTNFIDDWLQVADEEATHFRLLADELVSRGSAYGAYPAHRGLWDMVCKTRNDPLHRMALVPRVMEARGLDVTPAMIDKFEQFGDTAAVAILEVIYRDEVGHVRIGNYWYRELCRQQRVEPQEKFFELVDEYLGGQLRGPFNRDARIEAGFLESEIEALEAGGLNLRSNARVD